jgi:hypothetical protein
MGKNFSGNTNKKRSKSDFYQTPYYVFDTRRKGAATIHWLDSSEDVARKGK